MRDCAVTQETELAPEELSCLLATLQMKRYSGKHLEIGTAAGGTLREMMKVHTAPFVVVDPMTYFPNQLTIVKHNLREHGQDLDRVEFRKQMSHEAFLRSIQQEERFDFIFIDGNHKIRYVTEDLRWSQLLNIGGTLALHDYGCAPHRGVKLAVDRFLRKNPHFIKKERASTLLLLEKAREGQREVTTWDLLYARLLHFLFQMKRILKKIR